MEAKIKTKMQEKIKSKEATIGLNSTVRAYKKGQLAFIVYAPNLSEEMFKEISKLDVEKHEYEGDSEALAIACSRSFNVSVVGVKK